LAAATRHAVIAPDVIEDPSWDRWRWLANRFGYRAFWSFPVETANGKILGTFAMYYREPTQAEPRDLDLALLLSRTAAKIISKH
jgi:two-component system CheB/CheR fusion protein